MSSTSLYPTLVIRAAAGAAALAAVAVTALTVASGVHAGTAASAPAVAVAYGRLDLSRPADAQQLYGRLQQASSRVCHWPSRFDASAYARWQQCYDGALRLAVLQVDAPELMVLWHSDPAHAADRG